MSKQIQENSHIEDNLTRLKKLFESSRIYYFMDAYNLVKLKAAIKYELCELGLPKFKQSLNFTNIYTPTLNLLSTMLCSWDCIYYSN